MADLTKIGLILGLIGGILAVISGVLRLIGQSIDVLDFGNFSGSIGGGDVVGAIITIIVGVILIFLYTGKVSIGEGLVLGIVVIVLGLLGGGILAIIGGILIIIDALT